MKRLFTLACILAFIYVNQTTAQVCGMCAIDYGYVIPGVYPDTLPPATAGEYYEFDITFVMQEDTTVEVVGTLEFLNYHIMAPVGVPYGMNVSTNLGDFPVDYDPDISLYGCAKICGTPLVAGWYEVTVPLIATLEYPGGDQAAEYSMFIEVLPAIPVGGGIIPSATFGCEPLSVDFETSIHSFGADGFTYSWDFGNGSTSDSEFPPTQTYTAIDGMATNYIVTHTITIDTIGYALDYVTALASGCDDCTIFGCTGLIEAEKPDLYIIIDALGINTEPGFEDTYPPVTFSLGVELDPAADYTMQMKDDDGGLAGSDDNCGSFDFEGDDVGVFTLSAGSHDVEVSISHPVISYTFYDTITVYPVVAVPDIAVAGETIFCEGDSVILSSSEMPDLTYQWFKDGDEIPGASTATFIVYETGVYSLTATGVGGCNASSSETAVEVYEVPSPPALIVIDNLLTTSSTWDVQWYYNGDPIPGATETTYYPAVEGTYQVAAINGPCIAWSVEIDFVFQPITDLTANGLFKVYPNPNNGVFMYELTLPTAQDVTVKIVNVLGETISSALYQQVTGTFIHTEYMAGQPPGIYFLQMESTKMNAVYKVMINNK